MSDDIWVSAPNWRRQRTVNPRRRNTVGSSPTLPTNKADSSNRSGQEAFNL